MPRSRVDVALGAAGLALAGTAIWFPWHVHMSPQDFGAPEMTLSRYDDDRGLDLATRRLPRPSGSSSPFAPSQDVDRTTTGSIGKVKRDEIEVLFAVADRAVVRRRGRLELWHPGTVVRGDVRVAAVTADALILSDGRRLRPSGPRK